MGFFFAYGCVIVLVLFVEKAVSTALPLCRCQKSAGQIYVDLVQPSLFYSLSVLLRDLCLSPTQTHNALDTLAK